jgi:catalase
MAGHGTFSTMDRDALRARREQPDPAELGGPVRAKNVIGAMEQCMNGVPGFRRGHARGIAFRGRFTATPEAAVLTTAEHMQGDPVDTVVRLSNGGASPYLADRQNAKTGNPLGIGVRFELTSGATSTWTALSLTAFPPRTPDDFLAMVEAQRAVLPGATPNPLRIAAFLARRPYALAGIKDAATLKPTKSWATTRFNGMHAYWLVDADGARQAFRFRWLPLAGSVPFDPADDAALPPQYLVSEIRERIEHGPVAWDLVFQLADRGDPTADMTKLWPEDRRLVTAGRLTIDRLHEDPELVEGYVFDPLNVPPGIEPSDDPVLHFRSEAYAESHRRRTSESKPTITPA